ncbi:MAG TPA: alpha/beta hydrolase [Ktedonobacteraceae bacterium]
MRRSLFVQRCVVAVFGILAICAGWFLHDIPLSQAKKTASSVQSSNTPVSAATDPISSRLNTPSVATPGPAFHSDAIMQSSFYQLTSGLRPGRGVAIPAASSVQELPVTDVTFYNWRGELLSGWLALQTPQAPVIILAHGTPGNRVSMISRAAFLYKHGYNILLFDFQSYGKSQGVMSTLGMVESEDILAAISYIHGLPDMVYSKVGVLGLSMGATAAVLAAAHSRDIEALVAESCPEDATLVTSDVPSQASRQADQELIEQVYGVDVTKARPIDVVGKLAGRTAIFFINGDNDGTTPLDGMQSLYQAAGQPKQELVAPGAGHAQSFDDDTSSYIAHVDAFFDKHLMDV